MTSLTGTAQMMKSESHSGADMDAPIVLTGIQKVATSLALISALGIGAAYHHVQGYAEDSIRKVKIELTAREHFLSHGMSAGQKKSHVIWVGKEKVGVLPDPADGVPLSDIGPRFSMIQADVVQKIRAAHEPQEIVIKEEAEPLRIIVAHPSFVTSLWIKAKQAFDSVGKVMKTPIADLPNALFHETQRGEALYAVGANTHLESRLD